MHIWAGQQGIDFDKYEIYLDGVKQKDVFEVDEEAGKVWKYVRMSDNTLKKVGMSEELEYRVHTGKVEIKMIDQQSNMRGDYTGMYNCFTQDYCGDGVVVYREEIECEWLDNIPRGIFKYEGKFRIQINGHWFEGYGTICYEQ